MSEIIKNESIPKASQKFFEDIMSVADKNYFELIDMFKNKKFSKEEIIELLPKCSLDENLNDLGFAYQGPLYEQEGYENVWCRHFLCYNEEYDIKAVFTDTGNSWCTFVSLLDNYNKEENTFTKEDYNEVTNYIEDYLKPKDDK